MATLREGNRTVLLVVDAQVDVMRQAWDAARVIDRIAGAVDRARDRRVPVVWVQHSDGDLPHGSPGWQWAPPLAPADDEARIDKHFNSSFEQTTLEAELAALGATRIVLAGAATNWCIRATAYGALERGYDLTLVSDAHTTESLTLEDGTVLDAERLVADLNLAMTWLSYPGRSNTAVRAADLDFDAAPEPMPAR